jgi:hypothetical protein
MTKSTNKIMLLASGLAVLLAATMVVIAQADIPIRRQLVVYIDRQGQPYQGNIDYTISCYGYSYRPGLDPDYEPGSYTPEEVFSYSDACDQYGCSTVQDTYLNYRHIDSCNLEVLSEGKRYVVENFAANPFGECRYEEAQQELFEERCELRFDIPNLPEATPVGIAARNQIIWMTGWSTPIAFMAALVLTWLVELPVLSVTAFTLKLQTPKSRLLLTGILASGLTLPYLWFVMPAFIPGWAGMIIGEIVVWLVEMLLYRGILRCGWGQAALLSLATNLASYVIGKFVL